MKFSDQYPIEPLAAAFLRLLKNEKRLDTIVDHEDPMKMLFHALTANDAKYSAFADRPHSLESFRAMLESHAVQLHRDYGVKLHICRDDVYIHQVDQ
jgi:hypothetical protein